MALVDERQVVREVLEDVHRENLVDRAVGDGEAVGEVRDDGHRWPGPAIQPDVAGVLERVAATDIDDDGLTPGDPYPIPHRVHPGESANRRADPLELLHAVHLAGQVRDPAVEAHLHVEVAQADIVGEQVAGGRRQPRVVVALTVRGQRLGGIHPRAYPQSRRVNPSPAFPGGTSAPGARFPRISAQRGRVSRAGGGNDSDMSGKQREGTNQGRRALARDAREAGVRPSAAGVTLGASKQRESLTRSRRAGPPLAGQHKPVPARAPQRRAPERPWPISDAVEAPVADEPVVRYRDLVSAVGRRIGLDFGQARQATEAAVVTLARILDDEDRARFLGMFPRELRDGYPLAPSEPLGDLAAFLREVGRLAHRTPEQARYGVQAVLDALLERYPAVLDGFRLPSWFQALTEPLEPGGGLVSTDGHTASLTAQELRAALATLPYWTPTTDGLVREIALPAANLERVLRRVAALRNETGRAPHIGRLTPETARLVVRTTDSPGEVTAIDVELARRVDAAIEEAGAGIAS